MLRTISVEKAVAAEQRSEDEAKRTVPQLFSKIWKSYEIMSVRINAKT